MRRQAIILLTVTGLLLGIVLTPWTSTWAAVEAATLKSVALSASSMGTELVLRVDGDYSYRAVQASPDTLFIDLAGVKADRMVRSQQWVNPVFSGYKLLRYKDASGQAAVRVQVDTKQTSPFVVQKDGSTLRLLFGRSQFVSAAAPPSPVAAPEGHSTHIVPPAPPGGPLLVSKVTLDEHESGETIVDVFTSRSASYRVMTLASPARLVVDFDGARNTSPRKAYPADTAVLKLVRIGQFRAGDPSIVRVVAELNGNPAFDVHATPEGVRIELRLRGAAKSAPLAVKAPVPQAKPDETKIVQAAAVAPPPVIVPKVAAPAPTTVEIKRKLAEAPPLAAETRDAAKRDIQSTLPAGSKQVVAAPLPPPPSATPGALRAEHAAQTLTPGEEASPLAAQGAPPATPAAPPQEAKPVYTGEPISLNLKDVDLKDFFRLIHEISGLNIIIDPNVTGSVTLVLDSVPWDQALDIVLKNNRLGKVLEGNVLRIARVETLTGEQEGQTKLASVRMDAAPLVTVFRPVNYAKASDIATLLKTWAGGGALSRRGTVLVDARDNMLIVSDVQSQIPIIQNIITKLDRKAKQISIEARVVLATADFSRTLAAALSGSVRTPQGSTQIGGVTGTGATVTPVTATLPAVTPGLAIPTTSGSGFGAIAITNASSRYLINAVISAQEERDQAKTISRPTIVTQNNVQGMVQQGVQVPITTSINNTVTTQMYNATLELTVTPQVTDDGNIFMTIMVNNGSVGSAVFGSNPSINTQQATTSVLVPDGGTVIFGGITVTSRTKAATYVPLLGNIPILGHLFKSSNVEDTDQELLFFVSPKILPG